MAVNPFGGAAQAATQAPAEEAQQQTTPSDPWQAPVVNTAPVSAPSEGKVVMTFKEGDGFAATWNVVHANSVAEAKAILADPEFKELLGWQKDAATFFRGGPVGGSGGGGNRSSAPRQQAPAGAASPPAGAPAAPGPDWVYKTGIAKSGRNAGKQWHAWMPPQHLKDSEDPLWFDL